MTETRDTYLLLRAFVDELARCEVAGACTSPGSRSTPLVLSLVRDGRIPCFSHVDERAAGFFAVGLAKATGLPAVVACTSGTAAANFLPAVIEAREARVPLIVLTADRPPELRDVGAGQTIDQLKLYGSAAKWFFELGTHTATPERLRWVRQLACRTVWTALDGPPGPVHVNVPMREPLVLDEPLPDEEPGGGGRPDGEPWVLRTRGDEGPGADAQLLCRELAQAQRPVVVVGRWERQPHAALGRAAAELARRAGAPLLADPLSGARRGEAAVAHYDALLRDEAFAAGHRPDLVIRAGDLPTSKPLRQWLAGLDARQVLVDPDAAWQDPSASVALALPGRADLLLAAALDVEPAGTGWLAEWRSADTAARQAIEATLGDDPSEPRIARELAALVPADGTLFVASSMPVRDVETFWPSLDEPPRVLSNRGANGIDGTISAAYGAAAASAGPTVLLTGDVTLAHDIGGLLAARRLRVPLTVVVLDNAGGGIFDFLAVASQRDAYEEHVATPTGLDVEAVAGVFDCAYAAPVDLDGFRAAVAEGMRRPGTTLVHVRTERAANVALHRRVWDAVRHAL